METTPSFTKRSEVLTSSLFPNLLQILRLRCLSLLLVCITCLFLCADTALPPQGRNVEPIGPSGTLNPVARLQDSIGTATQVWRNGPMEEHRTIAASRSGPMSAVYRSALASDVSPECQSSSGKCEVAINGFGTVGEVHYTFNDARENLQGRSTQVMVACRCIGQGEDFAECGVALLVRPVNLTRVGADGKPKETGRHACIYEAVGEKFSDCHWELVRRSNREAEKKPDYRRDFNFTYEVPDELSGDYWRAEGQRGWTYDCDEAEFNDLPKFNISELRGGDLQLSNHTTAWRNGSFCTPPKAEGVRYYRDSAEGGSDECAALYAFAALSSDHIATQQDEIAVGQDPHTYISEKTQLTSYTELALSVSAACLGVLFAWSMYRKIMKKKNAEQPVKYFLVGLLKQVLSYALEALPLHIALAQEVRCRHWRSQFAFMDATITLAHGFSGAQGSARDSLLVITAVMGEVKYLYTNESLLALITVLFDFIALTIFVLTIMRKTKHLLEEKRARENIVKNEAGLLRMPEGLSNTLRRLQRRTGIRKSRHHVERSRQWRSTYSSQSVTSNSEKGDLAAEANTSQSSMSSLDGSTSHSQLPLFHGMEEYEVDRDAARGNMDVRSSRNTRSTSAEGTANTKGCGRFEV